jgi:oligo-1,6-glucosidase
VKLRGSSPALIYGGYKEYYRKDPNIFVYTRSLDGEVWLIVCSFCRERIPIILPKQFMGMEAKLVLTNYPALRQQGKTYTLPKPGFRIFPYEAAVLRMS